MADEAKNNPALITLSLALLTGFLAYIGSQSPLTSERPKPQGSEAVSLIGDQRQPARLWQDPLSVDLASTNASDTLEMRRQIEFWRRNSYAVCLLGVFVEGTPYAEDVEVRLRLRYAVQTALMESNFAPADRTHLGVMSLPWPPGTYLDPSFEEIASVDKIGKREMNYLKCHPLTIPFEWFTRNEAVNTNKAVLVMWLREEEFADYPLTRLLILDEALTRDTQQNLPAFKILGPRSSNTLKLLAFGLESPGFQIDRSKAADLLPRFEFWSPEATAPDSLLYSETNSEPRHLTKQKLAQSSGITNFHNLIALDDQLATNLVQELIWRGVTPTSTVALVSEADTLYGRSLPLCFRAAFSARRDGTSMVESLNSTIASPSEWPANIWKFNYLRGLDGSTARESKEKHSEMGNFADNAKSTPPKKSGDPNRAEGDSQFDYATRLAEMIRKRVDSEPDHCQVSAIGVLGSDIYDKLILLQALRPVFPDALFFTTDLDARYLDPEVHPYTRNLIVASAYGLSEENTTRPIATAPFRDVYQTAVYVGCKKLLFESAVSKVPEPSIYEIGRTEAVEFPSLWPTERMLDLGRFAIIFLSILTLIIVMVRLLRRPSITDDERDEELILVEKTSDRWQASVGGSSVVALLIMFVVVCHISGSQDGEPFYFAEGVSIWPTEFIRLIAIFLGISFLVRAWHRHKRQRFLVWREYLRKEKSSKFADYLAEETSRCHEAKADFAQLFGCYVERGLLSKRLSRSILAVVLYIAALMSLVFHFGTPFVPYRGDVSKVIDMVILMTSIFAFCLLAFYVLDAVWLTTRFISGLGRGKTIWPDRVLTDVAQKRNMDPQHLEGYLNVMFTSRQTLEVYSVVPYPFIILSLLFVARNQFFAHWTWPAALLMVFVLNGCVISISALWLRSVARRIREASLEELKALQLKFTDETHQWGQLEKSENYGDKLRLTSEEIKEVKSGAYAALFQDATLTAVLIPSGGVGLVALLQKLFLPG